MWSAADADTESSRSTYLDGLASVALTAKLGGKVLISSQAGGTSASYKPFDGWRADDTLQLIDWCRDVIGEASVEDAIALIKPRVRSYQTNTTMLRVYG